MAPQLASGVEDRLEDPCAGKTATLIIGVTETSPDVIERVEAAGAIVEEELFYNSLAVSIDEADLGALCSSTVVETVEVEGEWRQLDSGNFRTRPGSSL